MARTRRATATVATSADADGEAIPRIGAATSRIVAEAAALLDEEVAAGIVAARRMQARFQDERRVDPADFRQALDRFAVDGHRVVDLLHGQFAELRSDASAQVVERMVDHSHQLLDLVVGLVNIGAELGSQLVAARLPPPPQADHGKRKRKAAR